MNKSILNSRLARRLVKIFVLMVAVPLVVTALLIGHLNHEQTLATVRTMEGINTSTVRTAEREFQSLGRDAVRRSSTRAADISIQAIRSVASEMEKMQAASLTTTADDLSRLIHTSYDNGMERSLKTNRATMDEVRADMQGLFAQTARNTQAQAAGNIEKAMFKLVDAMIEVRARSLAETVAAHVHNATDYLTLTAQMPDLRGGNIRGQKAILDALVRRYPMFSTVSVLDSEGRETAMASAEEAVTTADLGRYPSEAFFRDAMRGSTYVGLIPASKGEGAPVLRIAVPIEMYRGKVVGALAARLSLLDLWEQLRSTRSGSLGDDGMVYVLDKNDVPLLRPRPTKATMLTRSGVVPTLEWRVVVAEPRDAAMREIDMLKRAIVRNTQNALQQMQGNINRSAEAVSERLSVDSAAVRDATMKQVHTRSRNVFERLKRTTSQQAQREVERMRAAIDRQSRATQNQSDRQMVAASTAASARLNEQIHPLVEQAREHADRRLSVLSSLILLPSCILSSLLALLVARRIVRPVAHLAQVSQAIAKGDLEKRVDENAPDEIGDMARAFNIMASSLHKSRADLHDAEAQLVQSAKLASLGTLSAGVAHELNQPLAIIRGISQQLMDEEGLSNDALEDLAMIEGQTSRMKKIIQHLRSFSRIGTQELADVDVNTVIDNCFILITAQLKAHDIAAKVDLGPGLPPVRADANELEQIFLNLITNARDALEGRSDARISIRTWAENEQVCIEFRDNGTGIPEAILSRIFDPFFTTKEPGKGTGLGLSISHSIIEKHKGTVRVSNAGGAVFTIRFPAASADTKDTDIDTMATAA